jgi:hypothetical protein
MQRLSVDVREDAAAAVSRPTNWLDEAERVACRSALEVRLPYERFTIVPSLLCPTIPAATRTCPGTMAQGGLHPGQESAGAVKDRDPEGLGCAARKSRLPQSVTA